MLLPPIPNFEGKLLEKAPITRLANIAMELRRFQLADKILSHRVHYENKTKPYSDDRIEVLESSIKNSLSPVGFNTNVKTNTTKVKDAITIIDLDYHGPDEGIGKIQLPFIPRELNFSPESSFVAIKPMGRNNPKYHYTGSEDHLEFEIDWHSFDIDRYDVITKCRKLEALSKGDAYNYPPHRIIIQWGDQDALFRDFVFLVIAAPYRLTQFNKASDFGDGNIQKTGMMPIQAMQKVTLSRITSINLSHEEIMKVSKY